MKVRQLFSRDLALENDYLRQENRILRRKLGPRPALTEAERRILMNYGLRIKDRLTEVISIVKPETLLAWNRRQKQKKWFFEKASRRPGRPRKPQETEALVVRLAEENNSWGYQCDNCSLHDNYSSGFDGLCAGYLTAISIWVKECAGKL